MSDSVALLEGDRSRHKCLEPKVLCPLLVSIGLLSLTTAVCIGYFSDNYGDSLPIRIMALNTWGMPELFGAKDKDLRMKAIGRMLAKQEYDLYLFEELWLRPDHNTILQHLPHGYHMTSYDSMTQKECPYDVFTPGLCCDGAATPSGCSGLAIASRFPFTQTSFTIYNKHGPIADGEKLARKGFGRVRIAPKENVTIDVFVTHTCANDEVLDKTAREHQVAQLLESVQASSADFALLGGDFNSDPRASNEATYAHLKKTMASSMEDFFKHITDWLVPKKASYGNPRNSYSNMYAPVLYDYIWHRTKPGNLIVTNMFDLPFLTTTKTMLTQHEDSSVSKKSGATSKKQVSLSDHEAVSASLYLFKKKY